MTILVCAVFVFVYDCDPSHILWEALQFLIAHNNIYFYLYGSCNNTVSTSAGDFCKCVTLREHIDS